jgi:hypothetical protein
MTSPGSALSSGPFFDGKGARCLKPRTVPRHTNFSSSSPAMFSW